MKKKVILYSIFAIVFSFAMEALGGAFYLLRDPAVDSFAASPLTPPPIVFPIVWTILYGLLAVSFALILIRSDGKQGLLYRLNGVLSVLWTYIYFGKANPGGALILLVVLIALTLYMFYRAYQTDRLAAYLLLPYLLWLAFATVLTYDLALLN